MPQRVSATPIRASRKSKTLVVLSLTALLTPDTHGSVPTLTVRNLTEDVHRSLRLRAAAHGRSVEAEVRDILAAAVASALPGVAEERTAFVAGDNPASAIGLWKGAAYPEGRLMSEDHVASARLEAAREGREISAEEFADLTRRLGAFEIDLRWVESFLEERRRHAGG